MNTYELENVKSTVDSFTLFIDSCKLEKGRIHVIAGPNGCGKTTLLDLLSLTAKPSSGSLSFQGTPVSSLTSEETLQNQRAIAYLMQNPYLFNMSVFQNVAYGLKVRSLPADQIKSKVQDIMEHLALSHLADRNAHHLSKGEAQRVAIARTLAIESNTYILDEPLTNVDRDSIPVIKKMISSLKKDQEATVIIAAHSHELEKMADNIISLDSGKIAKTLQQP